MKLRYVLVALVAIGCGGGGSDGNTTGPGPGPGTGDGPGTGAGTATGSASVATQQSDDGYGTATFSFSPRTVNLTRGGTVTWTNPGGAAAHNVTFAATAGAPTNIADFSSGSPSRVFSAAGSYSYQCTNHPGMSGTVNVQ